MSAAMGVMGGLLFNRMAAGVLTLALVGAGGSEIWRRVTGAGQHHSTAPEAAHVSGPAPAPGANPAPIPAVTQMSEGVPVAGGDTPPADAATLVASAPEAGAAAAPGSESAPLAPAGPDYVALLAAANIEEGKTLSVKCTMCHDMSEAKKTLMGPPLHDLFGRDVASVSGYAFTTGPGSLSNVEGVWDAAMLDSFLENPKQIAPGTIMVFPGMKREGERIALMAYIRSLTAGEPAP